MKGEELGTAKVDPTGRIYLPKKVQRVLNIRLGKDYISYEKMSNGCIAIFKGHLRFLRNNNENCEENYQPLK